MSKKAVNDVKKTLSARRSIRKYKTDFKLTDKQLNALFEVAKQTANASNLQNYGVIVSREEKAKKALFELHFRQPMILQASAVLTFIADLHRTRKWLKVNEAGNGMSDIRAYMGGVVDAVLFAQSVALAAEVQGLGICYMGSTLANVDAISQHFSLPKHVAPVTSMVIGMPDEDPDLRERLPLEAIVHDECYNPAGKSDIDKFFTKRDNDTWDRYLDNDSMRAKIEKSGVTNAAQVIGRVKFPEDVGKMHTQNLLRCLVRQQFLDKQDIEFLLKEIDAE